MNPIEVHYKNSFAAIKIGNFLAEHMNNAAIVCIGTDKCIIAVDACLSNKKNQGIIEIREGSITPGKGIGKFLPEIGDISIIGIVNSSDKEFHDLVQDTRLSLIYDMAEIICGGVLNACSMNISESFDQASISRA